MTAILAIAACIGAALVALRFAAHDLAKADSEWEHAYLNDNDSSIDNETKEN